MLEVALTPTVAPSVAGLLQEDTWRSVSANGVDGNISEERWGGVPVSQGSMVVKRSAGVDSPAKCAIFYSISSTQSGLVRPDPRYILACSVLADIDLHLVFAARNRFRLAADQACR